MSTLALRPADPRDLADLATYLQRVRRLDASALLRLKSAGRRLGVFSRLPMAVLGLRALPLADARLEGVDAVAAASEVLQALESWGAGTDDIGAAPPPLVVPEQPSTAWPGHLPALSGWEPLGSVRVEAITEAVRRRVQGWRQESASVPDRSPAALDELARRHWADPVDLGPGPSGLRFGSLHALDRLGFLTAAADLVRVSRSGGWLRLDAAFGSVLQPPPASGVLRLL